MASPIRTCIGCRTKRDQSALIRISSDFAVIHGPSQGRSAYVCASQGCIDTALSKGKIERAVRSKPSINQLQTLRQTLTPNP